MKITPLEIRQKNFEKKLRGYDKDEVSAFLISLSNEWERILDENKELKIRLEQSEKEVRKLREVESSLFKTLKTAEDTGANMIDQANRAAELHLREAEINAEAMLSESKSKSKAIIENAEQQAKEMINEMQEAIKDLEKNYRQIENHRDTLMMELENLVSDVKDRVSRTNKQKSEFKMQDHLIKVRELVRESEAKINKEQLTLGKVRTTKIPTDDSPDQDVKTKLKAYIDKRSNQAETVLTKKPVKIETRQSEEEATGKGSFFDEIGS